MFTFQYASIKPAHGSIDGCGLRSLHFNMLLLNPVKNDWLKSWKHKFTFQYASIKPYMQSAEIAAYWKFTFQYASIKPKAKEV